MESGAYSETMSHFVDSWIRFFDGETSLYLGTSDNPIFQIAPTDEPRTAPNVAHSTPSSSAQPTESIISDSLYYMPSRSLRRLDQLPHDQSFDLIVGDLPIGSNRVPAQLERRTTRVEQSWLDLLEATRALSSSGYGIFPVSPSFFNTRVGRDFQEHLNSCGIHIHAAFETPEGILRPITQISPNIAVICRSPESRLFVGTIIEPEQTTKLVEHFASRTDTESLTGGTFVDQRDFSGLHRIRAQHEMDRLKTQYKEYEQKPLRELASDMRLLSSDRASGDVANSLYIPKIGQKPILRSFEYAWPERKHYYQVTLKPEVDAEYVAAFFSSTLGRLVLSSISHGGVIQIISRRDLGDALVAVPPFTEQQQIATTIKKLDMLRDSLTTFNQEIALNPTSSESISSRIDSMLEAVDRLTLDDKVKRLIRQGESKTVEFKQTYSVDIKTNKKEGYIEASTLKTIVGFLNSEGGTLLIGVSDDGDIEGLDHEIENFHRNNKDKFLRQIKNKVRSSIGEPFYPYMSYELIDIDNRHVLVVEVYQSDIPCYLDGKDFFVRVNPATDKLEGPSLVQYIRNHFG